MALPVLPHSFLICMQVVLDCTVVCGMLLEWPTALELISKGTICHLNVSKITAPSTTLSVLSYTTAVVV